MTDPTVPPGYVAMVSVTRDADRPTPVHDRRGHLGRPGSPANRLGAVVVEAPDQHRQQRVAGERDPRWPSPQPEVTRGRAHTRTFP